MLENKRVEFFAGAKNCKRVRKNVKRKNLSVVGVLGVANCVPERELLGDGRQLGSVEIAHNAVAADAGQ